jgi:CRISPR system Cascade subunit CasD
MANTLFLRLEGPLQSWGERARWSVRDTASEPTKSGVVGLLGCALGVADDARLRAISQGVRMGVRCDRPGRRIVDYHTVGGGYDYPTLLTARGKPKKSSGRPHTELTWRHYLCDASFLVALQGKAELIDRLAAAIRAPHWPIYLGRKACIPACPPFDGVADFPDLETALVEWPWKAPDGTHIVPPPVDKVRAVFECSPARDGAVRRRDEMTSRSHRTFAPRYTCDRQLTIASGQEEVDGCISHA